MVENTSQIIDKNSCPIDTPVLAYVEITWDGGYKDAEYTTEWAICKRRSITSFCCDVIHDRSGWVIECEMIGWLPLPDAAT